MELILLNGCKSKKNMKKIRHVKNNDKTKNYILRGQKNMRYHYRILSNKKKSYNLTFFYNFTSK